MGRSGGEEGWGVSLYGSPLPDFVGDYMKGAASSKNLFPSSALTRRDVVYIGAKPLSHMSSKRCQAGRAKAHYTEAGSISNSQGSPTLALHPSSWPPSPGVFRSTRLGCHSTRSLQYKRRSATPRSLMTGSNSSSTLDHRSTASVCLSCFHQQQVLHALYRYHTTCPGLRIL